MKIAVDLDNTIDATPKEMQSLMSGLMAAGHSVVVLTGTAENTATKDTWDTKAQYLDTLGCSSCWNSLVIVASPDGSGSKAKAEWCDENGVDILIDNSKENAREATAAGVPLVLVPWASRS
jgi:hypothetical protein